MKTPTVRFAVVVGVLLGFVLTLMALRVGGASLLGDHLFAFLLAIAGLAVLASLGATAWDGGNGNEARPVAGGLRTFACVFVGAGFAGALGRGITGADGSGLGFTGLAIGIGVALLSASVDRRAWISGSPAAP